MFIAMASWISTAIWARGMTTRYLRFFDLKRRGIVNNRVTLRRWIQTRGFPAAVPLGQNTIAWREDEVEAWLAEREAGRAVKLESAEQ